MSVISSIVDSRSFSRPERRAQRAVALIALAGLVGAGAAACRGGSREGAARRDEWIEVGPQDVATAQRARISAGPRVSGTLEARDRAVLRTQVSGEVTSVEAEVGDAVRRGQVLARLDSGVLRDAVNSTRATVTAAERADEQAQTEARRLERLASQGVVTGQDAERGRNAAATAAAQLEEARARHAAARNQLDDATVESPIDGSVAERGVSQGDVVAIGALLFTVIDPSTMRLFGTVPSDALGQLRVGAAVEFQVRGYPDQRFTGTIERIAPAADDATRQIPILVSIPNPGGQLLAGLFAEGRIASATSEGLVVPTAAVDLSASPPTVKRVRHGRVEEVPVRLGLRDEASERVEVASGLQNGDRVLVGAARGIESGTPVRMAGEARAGR